MRDPHRGMRAEDGRGKHALRFLIHFMRGEREIVGRALHRTAFHPDCFELGERGDGQQGVAQLYGAGDLVVIAVTPDQAHDLIDKLRIAASCRRHNVLTHIATPRLEFY